MAITALVISIVSALGAAVAGVYTWRAAGSAQRSAVAAEQSAAAAVRSADAAEETVKIERQRRHTELTPTFEVSCRPLNPGAPNLRLTVALIGPAALGQLDELVVTIRDDKPARAQGTQLAGGPTREQITKQIWGPYRFVPGTGPAVDPVRGIPGADQTGRTTPTFGTAVGEALPFHLELTMPPPWASWTAADWVREVGHLLRLTLECRREGYEPWIVKGELDTRNESSVPF